MQGVINFVNGLIDFKKNKTMKESEALKDILSICDKSSDANADESLDSEQKKTASDDKRYFKKHFETVQLEQKIYEATGWRLTETQIASVEKAFIKLEGQISYEELYPIASKIYFEGGEVSVGKWNFKSKCNYWLDWFLSTGFLWAFFLIPSVFFILGLFDMTTLGDLIGSFILSVILLLLGLVGVVGGSEARSLHKINKVLERKKLKNKTASSSELPRLSNTPKEVTDLNVENSFNNIKI